MHRLDGRAALAQEVVLTKERKAQVEEGGGWCGSRELQHLATDWNNRKGEEATVTLRLSLG